MPAQQITPEYQPKKRRIIGNRKQIVAARKAEAAKALFDRIEVAMAGMCGL